MRLLPLFITVIVVLIVVLLVISAPKAKRGAPPAKANLTVATTVIRSAPYTVEITSFGRIEAAIRTQLRAQVGGRITYINPAFEAGGSVNKGEVLIEIEKDDFNIAQLQAKAAYIDAKRVFDEETARATQAQSDWRNAGRTGQPADLVLRKPQIAAAQARLLSAEAALNGAKLNLQRATMTAPYTARVLSRQIDPFQVITANTAIGEVFSTDMFEVTLPIRNSDYPLLIDTLPAIATLNTPIFKSQPLKTNKQVSTLTPLQTPSQWQATIVRRSANIDETSRQSFVVAQFNNTSTEAMNDALKLGQYVTASIRGRTIDNAIVIPNSSIYQGSYVYTFRDNMIYRQPITLLWQSPSVTIIQSGLRDGDEIVTSPLGQVTSGTRVKREGDNNTPRRSTNTPTKQEQTP